MSWVIAPSEPLKRSFPRPARVGKPQIHSQAPSGFDTEELREIRTGRLLWPVEGLLGLSQAQQ